MTWIAVWCEASGEWDRLSGGDQVLPKGLKAHLSPGGNVAGFSLHSCHPKAGESSQVWSCVLQTETFKRTKFSTSSSSLHCCYGTRLSSHPFQEHPSCPKWLLSTRLLLACCIKNISEVEVHTRVYCAWVDIPLMVARVLLRLGGFSQPINTCCVFGENNGERS